MIQKDNELSLREKVLLGMSDDTDRVEGMNSISHNEINILEIEKKTQSAVDLFLPPEQSC